MSDVSAAHRYLQSAIQLLQDVRDQEVDSIEETAQRVADSIKGGIGPFLRRSGAAVRGAPRGDSCG